MKVILLAQILSIAAVFCEQDGRTAEVCHTNINCFESDGCVCSSTISPLPTSATPQFISLTFDDAVTDAIYKSYYDSKILNRKNPDGNPISATFYVPHEYTDYVRVNQLYNRGYEIGVHSVSKNPLSYYWQTASVDTLVKEFGGQRSIISRFANVSIDGIVGARIPNFAMAGNRTFQAYAQAGIKYDNSWTAHTDFPFFPYTLDFLSQQYCPVGTCPDGVFPGMWVVPVNNLLGFGNIQCNSLHGCQINGTAPEISDWLMQELLRHYNGRRAPFSLLINSAWFQVTPDAFDGLVRFLDRVGEMEDVFVVSQKQVAEWRRNPVNVTEYRTEFTRRNAPCEPRLCRFYKGEEERLMNSCIICPIHYPWIDNPTGMNH